MFVIASTSLSLFLWDKPLPAENETDETNNEKYTFNNWDEINNSVNRTTIDKIETNDDKKEFNPSPWNDSDWKLDSEFLSEINKYCDDRNAKFFDIVENTIKGLRKVEEILVLY